MLLIKCLVTTVLLIVMASEVAPVLTSVRTELATTNHLLKEISHAKP